MSLAAILAIVNRALMLAGIARGTAALIRNRVQQVIADAERDAGKNIGDMVDTELAQLIEHRTKTVDELLGNEPDKP